MCAIEKYLKKEYIVCGLSVKDKKDLFNNLCGIIEKNCGIKSDVLLPVMEEREKYGVTGIGNGVAIPHCRMKDRKEIIIVLASLDEAIDYGSIDGENVSLVFMLIVPEGNNLVYLKLLSQLSIMCNDKNTRTLLMNAGSSDEVLEIVRNFD